MMIWNRLSLSLYIEFSKTGFSTDSASKFLKFNSSHFTLSEFIISKIRKISTFLKSIKNKNMKNLSNIILSKNKFDKFALFFYYRIKF